MGLQAEAAASGGTVASLLGNHEMMLLAAYRFGRRSTGLGSNFLTRWKQNGGKREDIASLTLRHLDWMAHLPAMALVDDCLLMHDHTTNILGKQLVNKYSGGNGVSTFVPEE